ncbi:hypothetical protein QTP88_001113 [Uroleucon formosanum]
MNINSGEIQDILTGSLLETSDDETRDVGIQVDENKGAIVNITNKDIIKTEKINLNTPEGYQYSQEIDKEKYLKTIREKELLNKSVRSLSPASDSDSSIKRRTGLRTDKGVVHTELPITKRIRKPKYMSEMDIDKATTLIPVCTGAKNLSEFINTCDIAVKSVDKNNLPLLIKIINSKLAGNTLEATKYRDTEKWEDIKSILKGAFEHRASERTLTIGLNFARMEENESVTSFASRVEELYYNLCTEGSKDMSEEESKVYKKQLKNQALIIFVNGLPKHLKLALKARDPKTLETAMQFAKDEEMEHNANLQMEKLTKNMKNQNLKGNNNTSGNNSLTTMGKYIGKTNRQSWSEEAMKLAIMSVIDKVMGYKKASTAYGVPQRTLENRVKNIKPVFTVEQEEELVNHVLKMEEVLYGLTIKDKRSLAFQLAETDKLPNNFNKVNQLAGKAWVYGFFERHPILSIHTPERILASRARGFNKITVGNFFNLLNSLYEKYQFSPDNIFNVDETGITTCTKKMSKIVGQCGKKQIGGITSGERGVLTIIMCMNEAGNYVSPHFIILRQRSVPAILDDAPPGSTVSFHPSGWIQTSIFNDWFDEFLLFSKPSVDKPVLLLLDGHATHVKNIDLIIKARENCIHLLCFPPYTTHRLQPLDVSLMYPLSTYYSEEVRKWHVNHPGRVVTVHQIPKLFKPSFLKACTMQTAVNGFEKTGIFPINPDIFLECMFAPAETTDIPNEPDNPNADAFTIDNANSDAFAHANTDFNNSESPSTTILVNSNSFLQKSPKDIIPIPKMTEITKRTESPYKQELEKMKELSKPKTVSKLILNLKSKRLQKLKKRLTTKLKDDDDIICPGCSDQNVVDSWVKCNICDVWWHERCTSYVQGAFVCDYC